MKGPNPKLFSPRERQIYTAGYVQALHDIKCPHGCTAAECPTRVKATDLARKMYAKLIGPLKI